MKKQIQICGNIVSGIQTMIMDCSLCFTVDIVMGRQLFTQFEPCDQSLTNGAKMA